MHKLEIKLKQHTPLIHFQHDQDGATLRASEVKPKLDKFILGKLSVEDCNEGEQAGWIKTKNESRWLDYKIRIDIVDKRQRCEFLLASYLKDEYVQDLNRNGIKAINNTSFFAQEKQNSLIVRSRNKQIDWDRIEKKGLLIQSDIILTILVSNDVLSFKISSNIQSFFVANNFGTRQSKGFGCFSVISIKIDDSVQDNLRSYEALLIDNFAFVYKKTIDNRDLGGILSTINNDYKLLKSGLTRPYAKSKLLLYADRLNHDIGWDKKYIKVNTNAVFETEQEKVYYRLKCRPENEHESYSEKDDYKYYRALLGLAEQFEFLLENPPANENKNKMIIKVKNTEIQRYQSPLLFKVFNNIIYLVGNDVSSEMLDKPFNFLVNFQGDKGFKDEPVSNDGTPIRTPSVFSLKDFMAFAMSDNTNNKRLNYQAIMQ